MPIPLACWASSCRQHLPGWGSQAPLPPPPPQALSASRPRSPWAARPPGGCEWSRGALPAQPEAPGAWPRCPALEACQS